MIDNLALGLTHVLMLLAAWRLLSRPDLDDPKLEVPVAKKKPKRGWAKAPASDA